MIEFLYERVYIADDCMLLFYCVLSYVMLSSTTRDEKHKNSEVLRLRGNGQGRTERKKFVTIEWNMFLRERTSYESYYYTSRCCRCRRRRRRRRSLTTLTDHHMWVYVFCMRARSLTFICLLYDFFFHHALLLLWKQNMNFYRQHSRDDLLWVWAQRNVICIYIQYIRAYASRAGEREREWRREQKKTKSNRIVLCKRRVRTHRQWHDQAT